MKLTIFSLLFLLACKPEMQPNGVTEEDFDQVIEEITSEYKPIFAQRGLDLQVEKNWDDNTENAFASRDGKIALVSFFGGLARNPYMTLDSFAFVVCHEIGHHEAGYPQYSFENNISWASVEGQADHFAATKCLKQYFSDKNNEEYVSLLKHVEEKLVEICQNNYQTSDMVAMCIRISHAARGFANFQASYTGQKAPDLSSELKPFSPSYNNGVLDKHPEAICRYQTSNYAAICPKNFEPSAIYLEPHEGYCLKNIDPVGYRHHCWFNPTKSHAYSVEKISDLPSCLQRDLDFFKKL